MFSPPETGPAPDGPPPAAGGAETLDAGSHRLDPRHVPCARVGGALSTALVAVVGAAGIVVLTAVRDLGPGTIASAWLGLLAAVALLALAAWAYPPLELRHCRWRVSSFGLEIRSGVWFRHFISVPRARIQHTDVERGPIERRFGLATLVVHTAGHHASEIRLDGLAHDTARAIRDHLLARADEGA